MHNLFCDVPLYLFALKHVFFWNMNSRDVTIHREPVENRFIYVTIQIGWDAKQIVMQLGVGVYMNVSLRGTDCL